MKSGSLDTKTVERFEKTFNYQMFRKSMLDILEDAGFDTHRYDENSVNAVALVLLRDLLGDQKLNEYMQKLTPPRLDLN